MRIDKTRHHNAAVSIHNLSSGIDCGLICGRVPTLSINPFRISSAPSVMIPSSRISRNQRADAPARQASQLENS